MTKFVNEGREENQNYQRYLELISKMHLTLNRCVTDLLKIDAHPAAVRTALFRLPRHSMKHTKGRRRIGRCLLSTSSFIIRCEIPLFSGTLERDHLFLRQVLVFGSKRFDCFNHRKSVSKSAPNFNLGDTSYVSVVLVIL